MKIHKLITAAAVITCLAASSLHAEMTAEDIADSINKLTFDFLAETDNVNNFFSPYSISAALAMTYAGARGETGKEMAQVLYFSEQHEPFHRAFHQLNKEIEEREQEGIIINIANALWADNTMELKDNYLNLTEKFYEAGVNKVDFINEPQRSREIINQWVEEETEDKIKDLLEPGSITPLTRLVLTNAIYFLGDWHTVFPEENTRDMTFYPRPEQEIEVPFMQQKGSFKYLDEEDCRIVEIPYKDKELAMVIILPGEDMPLDRFVEELDYERYNSLIDRMFPLKIDLQIPKFEFESKYNLKDLFTRLGMAKAFTARADFSGMTGTDKEFFIDEIIHQAFVEVDEKGTEAAAATAVTMRTLSIRDEDPPIFRADRPFLFFIRDTHTGAILFAGTLYNPE